MARRVVYFCKTEGNFQFQSHLSGAVVRERGWQVKDFRDIKFQSPLSGAVVCGFGNILLRAKPNELQSPPSGAVVREGRGSGFAHLGCFKDPGIRKLPRGAPGEW